MAEIGGPMPTTKEELLMFLSDYLPEKVHFRMEWQVGVEEFKLIPFSIVTEESTSE